MWHVMVIASRLLAGIGAAFSLYTLILYENEQGKVQNRLEEWWVKLSDRQSKALSSQALFMQGVAQVAVRGFDRLFGLKLLSLQSVTVSVGLSAVSVFLFMAIDFLMTTSGKERVIVSALFLIMATVCGLVTKSASQRKEGSLAEFTLPQLLRGILVVPTSTAVTLFRVGELLFLLLMSGIFLLFITFDISFSTGFLSDRLPEPVSFALGFVVPMIVLAFSLACDIGFIALTRLTLKWCSTEEGTFKIFGAVLLNSFLGVFLGIGPFLLSYKDWRVLFETKGPVVVNWVQSLKILGMALSSTNMVDVLAASTFTLLAIILLAHRLFWPILMRPTYVLANIGIIGRRKLFGIVGVALLGYAVGLDIHGWFKEIIGVVTK